MHRSAVILLVLLVVLALNPFSVLANATIVVNTIDDEDGTGTACSLREAIISANGNANYGGCTGSGAYAADTINFDAGVFATFQTISLSSDLPDITSKITINGPGTGFLSIHGNANYRPFYVNVPPATAITISNMMIDSGRTTSSGGALYVASGTVTVNNLIVSNSLASNHGGAFYVNAGAKLTVNNSAIGTNTALVDGGAIYTAGTLRVSNSRFIGNSASGNGGAIFSLAGARTTVGGSEFFGNDSSQTGGAFYGVTATVASNILNGGIFNSTFEGNTADFGGAVANSEEGILTLVHVTIAQGSNLDGNSGGIFVNNGRLRIYNSILADNNGNCFADSGLMDELTIRYSLIEANPVCGITDGVNGNIIADAFLDIGQDNGGPTLTSAISPASPAANKGSNSYQSEATSNIDFNGDGDKSDTLSTDQRGTGFVRRFGTTVDMGAFESTETFTGLNVDTNSDDILDSCTSAAADCSLRGAIMLANARSGTDTINFVASAFPTTTTITLTSDLPPISSNLNILGLDATTIEISGNNSYLPFLIYASNVVTISDLNIVNGYSAGGGGAITMLGGTLNLNDVIFTANHSDWNGGAIYASNSNLNISESYFNLNTADGSGGAIYLEASSMTRINNSSFFSNSADSWGGAIYSNSSPIIGGSTFSQNAAVYGGAIATHGGTIFNSTFHGHTVAGEGGAINNNLGPIPLYLINVTISDSSAALQGAGVYVGDSEIFIANSIIANSSAGGDCATNSGTVTVRNSLIEDTSCGTVSGLNGNLTGDPFLDPAGLQSNGGSTLTISVVPSSPVVDGGAINYISENDMGTDFNGDGDLLDTISTDQRGLSRTFNNAVDMGAYETAQYFGGLIVDTTSDDFLNACTSETNDCSLRGAITMANARPGADTISFYEPFFNSPQSIVLGSELPIISSDLTIDGPGRDILSIDGNFLYRHFHISSGSVYISAITLFNGHAEGLAPDGGSILMTGGSLQLTNSEILVNNAEGNGGAIAVEAPATLTILDSLISANSAGFGGAITANNNVRIINSSFDTNSAADSGGAVYNTASTTVMGSTFTSNSAENGGALALLNGSVANSTLYGNSATNGGAIYVDSGTATLSSVTISENSAVSQGSGLYATSSTVNIYNSIIANGVGGDCADPGSLLTLYNSLVEDGSCNANMGSNDSLMGDPFLDPAGLQDNGGTSQTMALSAASPAVNAGNNYYLSEALVNVDYNGDGDLSDAIETDQRGTGFNRVVNDTVDMGAFEATEPYALMVDTSSDDNLFMCTSAANDCSLRGAINLANANTGFTAATINFDTTVFATAQTITLTGTLPTIETDMDIVGPGASLLTISGAELYRAIDIADGTLNLSGMTIQDNLSIEEGGAIYVNNANLNLSNMSFADNVSQEFGGAIYLYDFSNLTVRDSSFTNNAATDGGGAIASSEYTSTILIIGSSFSDNSAGFGGAIDGSATIVNSSFNGNSATSGGGAINLDDDNEVLSLINVTINESSLSTGGALHVFRGTAQLFNTIIANSSGGSDCSFTFGVVSASYSMVEDGSCGITSGINNNLTGETFLDGTGMQNNGGLMLSVALAPISPARNAGNNDFLDEDFFNIDYNGDGDLLDSLGTDQRGTGFNRLVNTTVDMGAFEVSSTFAGLQVDTTSSENLFFCTTAPNDCSLRGAITIANTVAGADTITFDATVFATAQTIEPGHLTLTSEITINGPGSNLLTINGGGTAILSINNSSAVVTLSGMSIVSGWSVGNGGAINLTQGSLTVNSVNFANNIADNHGGAIYAEEGTSLSITNSTFSNNSVVGQGGAVWTEAGTKIFNSSFYDNDAGSSGGAIYSTDLLTIGGSSFEGNTAENGGALYSNSSALISNSSFYGNNANANGGAIYNVAQLDIVNVSIVANNSGMYTSSANVSILNSISAENEGSDCLSSTTNPEIVNSLFDSPECGILDNPSNNNIVALAFIDPRGLEMNGGIIETLALAPLGDAVDAGENSFLNEATRGFDYNADGDTTDTIGTDQRSTGFNRIINTTVDMGSFEASGTFAGLVVDTNSDSSLIFCTSAANDCSLRGAVTLANVLSGADTITFSSSVFNTAQTITLTGDLPQVSESLTITGSGANLLTISGDDLYRQFHINDSAAVSLSGMTIRDGYDFNGASIFLASGSLSLNAMSFIENTAVANGGAILTDFGTTLSITNSSFTSNSASGKAGAVYSRGILTVSNSSFTSNSAIPSSGAIYADGLTFIGGSSFNMNTADNGGAMEITTATTIFNSSFYNHSAGADGGTFFLSSSSLNLVNVTVTGGSASSSGGGVVVYGGTLNLMNSIIANSSGGDCHSYGGTVTVNFSLVEDGSCGVTSGVNDNLTGEPYLAPFANYGGTTRTIALLPHSPVINMGNSAYLNEANVSLDFNNDGDMIDILDTDQRGTGFNRVNNGTVDMGAFESNPVSSALNVAPIRNYYTTNTPTLSWSRVSWATGYEVQISSTAGFGTILCGGNILIEGSSQTLTTCELPAGTYYWRVRALSATGTGAWSTVDVFVIGGP